MVENGTIIPFAPSETEYNQWGEPQQAEEQWGEPLVAAVEVSFDDLLAQGEAGEHRRLSLTALVEGEGPSFSLCKAERLGEELGRFAVHRRAYYPFVGRTRYELRQC